MDTDMSQNRNIPPRTRPDLGRPDRARRTPRDGRARTPDPQRDDIVEGVTGVRPELPPTEVPLTTTPARRSGWLGIPAAAALAAAIGWVAVTAVASLAWLTAPVGSYGAVVAASTQIWLAGHGGGLYLGGTRWTLVPYGLTLLLLWLVALVSREVMRRQHAVDGTPPPVRLLHGGLVALGYAAVVGAVGLAAGHPGQGARAFGGAFVIAALAVRWAGARASGRHPGARWSGRGRQLMRALAVGLLTLTVVGSAAVVTGLLAHRGQLAVLTNALGGGPLGGLGAIIVQAMYLPTFIVWAVSYTLGAGFELGDGSLVAPSDTHLGLLPGWPITAALPGTGAGSYLNLLWLAGGLVAGGLTAWVYLRDTRWTRPDTCTVLGGGVGLLLGLLAAGIGLLTRGDLGVSRLVGLGPRPLELLVLAVTLATCGGLLTGLGVGISRWLNARRSARASASVELTGTLLSPGVPAGTAPAGGASEGTAARSASDTAPAVGGDPSSGTDQADHRGPAE